MKIRWVIFVLSLTAVAQTQPPEVRGIITDRGAAMPLGGAIVTLYEFAPNEENVIVRKSVATTITAPDGTFSFKPGRLARFMVGVKKDGYNVGGANNEPLSLAELDEKSPVQTIRMSLIRPGSLTGRVIDRDGNPVANLRVGIDTGLEARERLPGAIAAVTNSEGVFVAENLLPNPYIVRISPTTRDEDAAREGEELAAFNEDGFKAIDEDVELSYWPGGLPSPEQVLPVTVAGGAIANAGTITIRKVPYYRVRVTYNGECAPNERWIYRLGLPVNGLVPGPEHYASCRKDGLLTRLAPGSYRLAIWSGRDIDRWALTSFTISDRNIELPLDFREPATVTGRVSTPPGGPGLAKLGPVQILLRSSESLPSGKPYAEAKDGKFSFDKIPWKAQWISVSVQNSGTYVKEIRYNGLPLRSQALEVSNGATLDIVVDEGAATLNLILKNGEAPAFGLAMLVPASMTGLPPIRAPFEPFLFMNQTGASDGRINFFHVPPGDYRLLTASTSLSEQFLDGDGSDLAARLQQAPTITLGRGEQKSMEVQLKR